MASKQLKTSSIVTGPYDMAVAEQLREEAFPSLSEKERVSTDVFVWSLGESTRRDGTKIGGLPYWEQSRPWPVASSGVPMTFVAQFCFADSLNLVPALPGDLLLLFIEGVDWTEGWEAEAQSTFLWGEPGDDDSSEVCFEWVSLHNRPLVAPLDVPELHWHLVSLYGSIHRTWDYVRLDGVTYPEKPRHIPVPPVFEGTKIEGLCPLPNLTWFPEVLPETASYLCTLSSITMISDVFPFLNIAHTNDAAFKAFRRDTEGFLTFGDIGLMNIFVSPDGQVYWGIHDN